MSEPPVVRAVVDSNLLVRGILGRHPRALAVVLMDAIFRRRFRLVTSEYLLEEVRRTLRKPEVRALVRTLSAEQLDANVEAIRAAADVVRVDRKVDLVAKDPKDNPVVACALDGDAGYLVTDDRKHLLPLETVRVEGHRPVRIVTARDFLAELTREGR